MAAGYSGTPLIKKLGIKPGMKMLLIHPPDNYYQLLEANLSSQVCPKGETPDFIHLFASSTAIFLREMKALKPVCRANPGVMIWISWYKKAARIETDITETVIRNYALAHELVDVKVCAVSDAWSGLKLVVPLALR
jgi:hypothetical protein